MIKFDLNNENNKFNNIDEFLKHIKRYDIELIKYKKYYYYNIPVSFDIESTSIGGNSKCYKGNNKVAFMYMWSFSFCGYNIIGRTWEEFIYLLDNIVRLFNISLEQRLIIYVHNLAFEFQFLRKYLDIKSVFSLSERKPVKVLCNNGVEFRCSYVLSGYSLAMLGTKLTRYKIMKLSGIMDYELCRHSETVLTQDEINYSIKDVMVVAAYIQECIENNGDITKIPLTKTGYVRRYCRENCLYESKNHRQGGLKFVSYRKIMKELIMSPELYTICKQAFMGGFTHANPLTSNETLKNIGSFDETSAYPSVMVSEKFPMSRALKFKIKTKKDFNLKLEKYCSIFYIKFYNIKSKYLFENYIPISHCIESKKVIENNGRVVSANEISIAITNVDFTIINSMYEWEDMEIGDFYAFEKDYLPKDLVYSILKLYKDKTELKKVEGREVEYALAKEQLNACYGMMVTDICRDDIIYDKNNWSKNKPNLDTSIKSYNKSIKRFLFYPWGIFVTAYARLNLFTGILEFKDDYVYSDTDSLKCQNIDKHREYINNYNKFITNKIELALKKQNIDIEMSRPKNIKGEVEQMGVWDYEGTYDKFKTLGAKRYMYEKNNEITLTVSGLNKSVATPYLINKYGNNIFDKFTDKLYIPREYTGKNTHTYIDDEIEIEVTDYLGKTKKVLSKSGVHLEPCDYSMDLSIKYLNYLLGVKDVRR